MAEASSSERLLDSARALIARAHAPYSRFRVGAALEDTTGAIHPGVNVESVSFGLTQCAERNALFGAIARGACGFRRLALASSGPEPAVPCGACRQVLLEHAPDLLIVLERTDGGVEEVPLRELLPRPFTRFESAP